MSFLDKIKFINNDKEYECHIIRINDHVVRLVFPDDVLDSEDELVKGFHVYNYWNGEHQGDFSNYTTIYRSFSENCTYDLSDDESVYIEATPEVPVVMPETIENVKNRKIAELSSICKRFIEEGVDVVIDGNTEHFYYSIVDGDQEDIDSLFTAAVTTKLGQSYHCHNGNCRIYSVDQIVDIYVAQKANTMHHKTYFNQLKQYVSAFSNEDDIDTVKQVSYGDELTGVYFDTYNLNMANAQEVIKATLTAYGLQ